ncbi:MAG TPA: bifunctional diaminohydroxyphosphoribosylaminopyrimidine deaminase/5-amino-6-(5-phosphoribosylamino)uracil reductase RibD [Chitinispirillaceae bacterium]|nr:bifunctional diaminohydroxyphosphoribosylaminopyrimidine deaminase/5-amino-6-(5-phosphoribosylamino)uracil reductase RibD [Chitinispirillaceae bacterium]
MENKTEKDLYFMQMALELAREAKGRTFPNPAVGAVIVSQGEIVGKGATQFYGGPHAEKVALAMAKENARGAILYVTLEPCCHFGKTSPCTDAIIKSGISKVIFSVRDPNPLVSGMGAAQLLQNGIEVSEGLLQQQATELNEDFFWSIQKKQAWITLKLALTLDGKIADNEGNSKWITGAASREYVHELRRCHAAIAVGIGTLETDNPQLTVRHKQGYFPARIVFSSSNKVIEQSYFFKHYADARSVVVINGGNNCEIKKEDGIEYWYTGQSDKGLGLQRFVKMAYEQHLTSIFVEGGQRIASQFLQAGLVNRLYLFYGSKILGDGKNGISFSRGLPIDECISLKSIKQQVFDEDFLISGIPQYNFINNIQSERIPE